MKIGIALGGGGAKGFAHVPILEALDEMAIKPDYIAGCSIGAVIGALYAAGLSAREIRDAVDDLVISEEDSWREVLFNKDLSGIFDLIQPGLLRGSLLHTDNFLEVLSHHLPVRTFSQLETPLLIVAADYWERREVVLTKGDLLSAIGASAALPGLFKPFALNGEMMIDGGMVNPVPYDLLLDKCDYTIAVDVSGRRRRPNQTAEPGFFETVFNAFQIMQQAIMMEKLECKKPDLLIRPPLMDIRVLDFHKVDEIYRQAAKAKAQLQWELERVVHDL